MKENKEKLWSRDFIIISISYFFLASSFSLLMPTIPIFLSKELGVETSKIGIVLSSYVIALLMFRPFSGFIVDIYSRKPLLILGVSLFVATFFGYYFAATVLFLILLRFLHGIFWGMATVSSNTVAIDIIPASRRAEGIGFFGVNSNIAMAIAPYIAVNIYNRFGFHALITASLVMGVFSIVAVTLIRVPIRKKLDETPPISIDRFILLKGLPIFWNQLFISFGWGTLVAFAVLYGIDIGLQNSGIFFLFLALGLVLSRINSGKLVDKGHLHIVMQVALLLITIGFLTFASFHSIYMFCVAAFLIGLGYGTLFPALQSIYVNMAPSSQRGTANSTYLTGFDVGISLGMLVGAYFVEKYSFSFMYNMTACLSFIAIFIYRFNSIRVYERNRL
ncbi:MAG: MFS transporter [Brumimicrobium sp.]|nr:MFS transporter [Brumimicrobium sp.]